MNSKPKDFLKTEGDMKGMHYASHKQTILKVLRKSHWTGCMTYSYFYLSFHVNAKTGETREIPIAELIDEIPYCRASIYTALKALTDCGAIEELDGQANRYWLPHYATTAERRALVKRKPKPKSDDVAAETPSETQTDAPPQARTRERAQGSTTIGTRFASRNGYGQTQPISNLFAGYVERNTTDASSSADSDVDSSEQPTEEEEAPF